MRENHTRGNQRERKRASTLVDVAVEDGGDLLDGGGEGGEFGGGDGLHAVGEGGVGAVVDFDEEAVGADCGGGEAKGKDFVAFAGAVAGVDEDRQVAAASLRRGRW